MFANDFFQNIPNNRFLDFNQFFRCFDRCCQTHQFQFVENEWFEQFQRHQFWQTALMQFQLWTHNDNGTTGVVNTFTQQVLTETTAFTFDHLSQRFQWTLVRASHGFTATTVIEQGVNGFLQHTLFVACDDFWCAQFHQALQTVVTVDHTAIQIVQIGSRETTTVQRYQWTQLWWQHWQHFHDHPFWLNTRTLERFQYFQTLSVFLDLRFRFGFFQFCTQNFCITIDIDGAQQFTDTFCTHECCEFITVFFVFCSKIIFRHDLALFQRCHAWISHNVCFKVQNAFDIAQCHVQYHTQTGWQGFQEPDVCCWGCQFDMAHAFTTHFCQCDFNAALFANHTTVFETLVLTAQAFVIFDWAKNFGAEQTVAFWFERTIVDGFRLFYFAVGPGTDFIR